MKTKTSIPQTVWLLARLILTIVLLVFVFKKVDFQALKSALEVSNKAYIAVAALLVFAHVFLKSYKWYLLANTIDKSNSFRLALMSYLKGTSLAIVTPSRIGELGRAVGLAGSKLQLGSLTLFDKISELWIVVFFVLLGGQRFITTSFSGLIVAGLLLFVILLYQMKHIQHAIYKRMPNTIVKEALEGFTLVSWPLSNVILILSFFTMVVYFLQAYLLVSAFHAVSISVILQVFPLILLTNLIPLTIGSLGIREHTAVYLLSKYSIAAAVAVNVSLLLFFLDTVIPGVIGSFLFSLTRPKNAQKK